MRQLKVKQFVLIQPIAYELKYYDYGSFRGFLCILPRFMIGDLERANTFKLNSSLAFWICFIYFLNSLTYSRPRPNQDLTVDLTV